MSAPAPASEAAEIQLRIDDVTDRSVAATEHIVQVVDDTREVGEKTSALLVHQGHQLSGINRKTEKFRDDVEETGEIISKLECCTCGLFRRRRGRRKARNAKPRLEFSENASQPSSSARTGAEGNNLHAGRGASGPFIKPVTHDEREAKIESNLRYTSEQVTVLDQMARQQGKELTKHTELAEEAGEQMEMANDEVQAATKRLERIE